MIQSRCSIYGIDYIEKQLKSLSSSRIVSLAQKHLLSVQHVPIWSPVYWFERTFFRIRDYSTHSCAVTASGIMGLNLFQHKYLKNIHSIDDLEKELLNDDEGTFELDIEGSLFFTNPKGQIDLVIAPGHTFNIIKVIENKKIHYRLVQSYIQKYSLQEFLSREGYLFDFESLKEKVLTPLRTVVQKKGVWGPDECEAYCKISSIYSKEWIGRQPSNGTESLSFFGRRTTNLKSPQNHLPSMGTICKHILVCLWLAAVVALFVKGILNFKKPSLINL